MSKEYVVVTTLSHFKLKYAIPAEDFESLGFKEPIDTKKLESYIEAGNIKEFSQQHLGEVASDVSVYTDEDIVELFNLDNAYLASWTTEQKIAWIDKYKEAID